MNYKKLLIIALFFSPIATIAQSFEKGNIVVSAGAGLGIYNTYSTEKDSTTVHEGKTAAGVFPFGAEYGITNNFGVGAFFKYGNYIQGDSSNGEDARAIEFMIRPAFHFVNRNKLNMNIHADLGITSLKYSVNDKYSTTGTGVGALIGGGLDLQLYFTKSFGMFFRYSYYTFTYKNFTVDNNDPNQEAWTFKFKFDGGNSVIGLMFNIK